MQKDEDVALHREKYAGSQAERSSKAAADAEANKVANQLKGTKLSGIDLDILIYSPYAG
jgi:methionyl-tRNA synthetase